MPGNLYFYILAGVVGLALAIWLILVELRLKKFFSGRKAEDLESVLLDLREDLKKLHQCKSDTDKYLENVEKRLKQSIQKVGVIRFNPFDDTGSNQSFVIALLNEKGDGVVISSLYGRDGMMVYSKPIENYTSPYSLTPEEKEAIEKANLPTY